MSNDSPFQEFPENLPFGGPYDFFFTYFVWLPLVLRGLLLPVPVFLVWRAHRRNLTWLIKLIWNDLPGGRKLTMALGYGLVLPIILGTAVRALGPFGWESWAETPPWAARLFLVGLVSFWLWDLSRIIPVISMLRVVRRTKKKVAIARWGIDKVQKVASFLKEHTEAGEDAGRLKKAEAFVFKRARNLGKIPVDKALEKVKDRLRSVQARMMLSGLFFHLAPALLLYALVALDSALSG